MLANGKPETGEEAQDAAVQAEVIRSAEEQAAYHKWCTENIHVYQVDEVTWIAADSPESAVLHYLNEMDGEEETLDEFGDPVLLSEEAMVEMVMYDDEESSQSENRPRTFRESLDELFSHERPFPVIFATEH